MGINGLWKIVDGAKERQSLRSLSIRDGFEGQRDDRLYYVGVDVSIWVQQLQNVFIKGHAQSGENPELCTFFYRLCMLAERPIHLIFVADGPLRPRIKRKKQVKTAPHWLTEGMRQLVDAFGYSWLEAAGEAEAELARMNELGVIDAVLTEDSDTLVFGAQVTIRNPSYKRTDPDIVVVYRRSKVYNAGFSRADLLLLALLLGSDYDPAGLPLCGPAVARGLVKYGLGRSLYTALISSSNEELTAFLPGWRDQLRDRLRNDPHALIGRRHPGLAASVPSDFPNVDVARLFVAPALLPTQQYSALAQPRPMDIARIAAFCELRFTWGSRAEILKTFRTALWPGEAVRMLIDEGRRKGAQAMSRSLLGITVNTINEPAAIGYTLCRTSISDSGFSTVVTDALQRFRPYRHGAVLTEEAALTKAATPLKIDLPAVILERARPELINPAYASEGYLYGRTLLSSSSASPSTMPTALDPPAVSGSSSTGNNVSFECSPSRSVSSQIALSGSSSIGATSMRGTSSGNAVSGSILSQSMASVSASPGGASAMGTSSESSSRIVRMLNALSKELYTSVSDRNAVPVPNLNIPARTTPPSLSIGLPSMSVRSPLTSISAEPACESPMSICEPLTSAHSPLMSVCSPPTFVHSPPMSIHSPPTSARSPSTSIRRPPVSAHPLPVPVRSPPTSACSPSTSVRRPPVSAHPLPVPVRSPPTSARSPSTSVRRPPVSARSPPTSVRSPPASLRQRPMPVHAPPTSVCSPLASARPPLMSPCSSLVSPRSPPMSANSSPASATLLPAPVRALPDVLLTSTHLQSTSAHSPLTPTCPPATPAHPPAGPNFLLSTASATTPVLVENNVIDLTGSDSDVEESRNSVIDLTTD